MRDPHYGRREDGISYLLHADATVDKEAVAQTLLQYQRKVLEQGGDPTRVDARIYTQRGEAEEKHSACARLVDAFKDSSLP